MKIQSSREAPRESSWKKMSGRVYWEGLGCIVGVAAQHLLVGAAIEQLEDALGWRHMVALICSKRLHRQETCQVRLFLQESSAQLRAASCQRTGAFSRIAAQSLLAGAASCQWMMPLGGVTWQLWYVPQCLQKQQLSCVGFRGRSCWC